MKIITNHSLFFPKVLVCAKCKTPVSLGVKDYYSCEICNTLTKNVIWIKKIIT